jgi:hypothetical protein
MYPRGRNVVQVKPKKTSGPKTKVAGKKRKR